MSVAPGCVVLESVLFPEELLDDEIDHLGVGELPPVESAPALVGPSSPLRALPLGGSPVLAFAPASTRSYLGSLDLGQSTNDEGRDTGGPAPAVARVQLFQQSDVAVDPGDQRVRKAGKDEVSHDGAGIVI